MEKRGKRGVLYIGIALVIVLGILFYAGSSRQEEPKQEGTLVYVDAPAGEAGSLRPQPAGGVLCRAWDMEGKAA